MTIRSVAIIAALGAVMTTSAVAAGNAANGAGVFDRCAICHSNTKSGANKIGPNLFGVVGRKAGTYPGFSYSSAMAKAGFAWTDAKLDAYIAAPQTVVPGNKMPFAGLANNNQRTDLVAYLDTLK
jgi:cytochrome c